MSNQVLLAQETGEQGADTKSEDPLESSFQDSTFRPIRFLALEKGGNVKRIRFFIGDEIHFRLREDPYKYSPIIQDIGEKYITINNTNLALREIESVTIHHNRRWGRLFFKFFLYAGVGYFLIDMVNNSFRPTRETSIISSSLAAPGLALSLTFRPRRIKLNKNRYLKTIQKID
ncbi:MAG: hypothetical protein AAFU64_12965 [Bacteroidota bacterium]